MTRRINNLVRMQISFLLTWLTLVRDVGFIHVVLSTH